MQKTETERTTLLTNRAAVLLKLHDYKMAIEVCTQVLATDRLHVKALARRADAYVATADLLAAKVCACVCVCVRTCTYVYVCVYTRTCESAGAARGCLCRYCSSACSQGVCVCVSECTYVYGVCVYVYVSACLCTCLHVRRRWHGALT